MTIGNFDLGKGLGKFLGGALAIGIAYVIQNPALITKVIPEHWATMTVAGLVLEILDYLLNLLKKK